MKKGKGVLQKISLVSAVICFLLSVASGVMLYLRLESVGGYDPVTSSFLASMFFFVCVGFVLTVIWNADIPNFKVGTSEVKLKQ